jgi:diguanylate cyclase (GGDEF)-like protein/PAS domain S-box-containing protein
MLLHKEGNKEVSMKILIVDDNSSGRYLLETMLRASGYEVECAADGLDALERLSENGIGLIISDILMPRMDGFQLCREVKRNEGLRGIPFVFYTATYTDPKDEEFALTLGAQRFIVKPQEPAVFVGLLREVINAWQADLLEVSQQPLREETVYLKEYNERLVRKLEHKVLELENVNKRLRASEEKYRGLVDNATDAIVIIEVMEHASFVNRRFLELTGYSRAAAFGLDLNRFLHPEDVSRVRILLKKGLAGHAMPSRCQFRLLNKAGDIVHIDAGISQIKREGQGVAIQAYLTNVTERKRAETALRKSEERFRALYENNPSMYFTVDPRGMVLSVNRFGAEQLGYGVQELLGRPIFKLHCEGQDNVLARLHSCLRRPGVTHRWDVGMIRKDGVLLWARQVARVMEADGGTAMILIVCEDITEARRLADKVAYNASHDALTGLINRREFESRLERVLETARKGTTEHALCYLDLDHFKAINDSCGHLAGDELLRQLGGILKAQVRKRDTLARLGGDEFGVLMEHCPLNEAEGVANKLCQAVEGFRFRWEEKLYSVSASIGLVPVTSDSGSMTDVLGAADGACYAAKNAGRNRIHVYRKQDTEMRRWRGEMQWVAEIPQALREDRFQLEVMPIVPLIDGDWEGMHYEVLVRMKMAGGNVVPPGLFLPSAERYGLSTRVDRWVVDSVVGWLKTHPQHLARLYLCCINLSRHSLGDESFLHFIVDKLNEVQGLRNKICFEITETAAIARLASAIRFISTLKALGCRFALDDFGSGLSSFAYLKTLPVDYLKIDGVFVKDMADDPIAAAMVRSINDIGHLMGKKIVAEFVKDENVLASLGPMGIDYAQGYAMGWPRPLEEME